MRKKNTILYTLSLLAFMINECLYSQESLNPNQTKKIIREYHSFYKRNNIPKKRNPFSITLIQNFSLNSNLPNIENHNGLTINKGFTNDFSYLINLNLENVNFTIQPNMLAFLDLYDDKQIPTKSGPFSVLNDVKQLYNIQDFSNLGFKINLFGVSAGYGNWNQWWGPGIHNSLVLSNNSKGFYHYYISTNGYKELYKNFLYKVKFFTSEGMRNNLDSKYYLSSSFFDFKINNIEFGISRNIVSGGYPMLKWSFYDAAKLMITEENLKYWDQIIDYYVSYNSKKDNFIIFLELGYPNLNFSNKEPDLYPDHGIGRNFGMRKYGAFGKKEIMFGFEYTRLVQGIYYNILPSPNWYDNPKNNYFSYQGRRWAAHSGSDSDDFLIFSGFINEKYSLIYGLNYERHGVTYKFPPEVKFESRISVSYKHRNAYYYLYYENEYYEHYGFVDNNKNVWNDTFEKGSIQRTKTLLFSIEYKIL